MEKIGETHGFPSNVMKHSAYIQTGSSGGAALNEQMQLVGTVPGGSFSLDGKTFRYGVSMNKLATRYPLAFGAVLFFIDMEDNANLGVEIMDYHAAVEEEVVEEEAIPFALVEEKPKFQGGDANTFSAWVNKNLQYPEIAKENGVQGRVTLQFTVNTDGSVSDVKVGVQ